MLAFVFLVPLVAQEAVINPQGIVNAASLATKPYHGLAVALREIATILGQNVAASEESAIETPLPTNLAGTSVTVGGVLAPLFYVSPGQMNFRVPSIAFGPSTRIPVVVTTGSGA